MEPAPLNQEQPVKRLVMSSLKSHIGQCHTQAGWLHEWRAKICQTTHTACLKIKELKFIRVTQWPFHGLLSGLNLVFIRPFTIAVKRQKAIFRCRAQPLKCSAATY